MEKRGHESEREHAKAERDTAPLHRERQPLILECFGAARLLLRLQDQRHGVLNTAQAVVVVALNLPQVLNVAPQIVLRLFEPRNPFSVR